MIKSKMKYLILLVVLAISIVGCENKEKAVSDNQVSDNQISDNQVSDDLDQSKEVAYAYDQDLNIIEDNYRNYYEIFVYSYYDSDGDGIGDLQGVIEKLDYINDGDPATKDDMGFNGIWLMPIMPSTTYHKYDIIDYYDIDPEYGTIDDFKQLIEECNKRDIKVIIDFVYNHTSAKNQWFITACEYLQGLKPGADIDLEVCPYADYYNFSREEGLPGTYYQVGTSEWYYEGSFWDQMPDLNLGSLQVRSEIEQIANYWLELGVGGFRLDAIKEFYSGSSDKNIEVLTWFCDYVRSVDESAYVVGENWDSLDQIKKFYESGITSQFDFPLSQAEGKIARTVNEQSTAVSFGNAMVTLAETYGSTNSAYIDAPFLANHDNARVSNFLGADEEKMKMAAGLLMTMNGSPFVYYGEEIGMSSSGSKDENKRLPFIWSATDLIGMTDGPDNADSGIKSAFAAVDVQLTDSLSILNYYKRAIQIRNENPEIARGNVTVMDELSNDDICVIKKEYDGSVIYIVYNISDNQIDVSVKGSLPQDTVIRGYLTVDGNEVTLVDDEISLPKYSIVILK